MSILCISGSAAFPSSNARLLEAVATTFPERGMVQDSLLRQLPLYRPEIDQAPLPETVNAWRGQFAEAKAVIISTPEYLHNIPAVLKNGLEWLKTTGELHGKAVLPITFTPHPPRGKNAIKCLRGSLLALEARIVVELPLYQNALSKSRDGTWQIEGEVKEWLAAAIELL